MPVTVVLAILLVLAGAVLAYAGARHQQLLRPEGARSVLQWSGWGALLLALALMIGWFGPATAVFAWATLAMLVWSVVPLAAAWRRKGE